MAVLTQARLRELLTYDPETGLFIRNIGRSGPGARAGNVAGCDNGAGYIRIYVDGAPYKAHRLAWFYVHGEWPEEIDHKNGVRCDNRLVNLRPVTRAQNNKNNGRYRTNTTGLKGVTLYKPNGKWRAQIQSDGAKIALGYFDTPEQAFAAYADAARRLHGEYARVA